MNSISAIARSGSREAVSWPASAIDQDARWPDAVRATVALWLFVLLIYLPIIIPRHPGEGLSGIALDSWTVIVSMLLAMPLFAVFRASVAWPIGGRVAALVGTLMAVAVAQAAFDLLYTGWIAHNLESRWASLPTDLSRGYDKMIRYASVFAVNVALFQLSTSRRRSLRQERRLAAMLASGQQAELEALRFRLNPHFLFNTLNAISSMIVTRRNDEADETVCHLSSFLRASYGYDPKTVIPVEEELAGVEHYARIEETRFRDRLSVAVECDHEAAAMLMPALLIQPLVESAVDVTMVKPCAKVAITIAARGEAGMLWIIVAHDGLVGGMEEHAGFATVRRRLATLYGDRAGLSIGTRDGMAGATIWLPAEPAGALA